MSAALRGSASRKVIIAGDGEKSILVRRLLGLNLPRMPYGGPPLSSEQINLIRHWIDRGAPGPDSAEPIVAVDIHIPNDATSRVNQIVSGHRGQLLGFDVREGWPGWDTGWRWSPDWAP